MRVVTLDTAAVARLASRRDALAEFPFLANLTRPRPPKRSCCTGGASDKRAEDAKAALAGVSGPKLAALKRLLGADSIDVVITRGGRMQTRRI